MPEYIATYEITHGFSNGFGLKDDDHSSRSIKNTAESDVEAFIKAAEYADSLAKDYLTDTNGKVTVKMNLRRNKENLNLRDLLRERSPHCPTAVLDQFFPDEYHFQTVDYLFERMTEGRI